MTALDDLSLMRHLAQIMGWEEWQEGAASTGHYFVRDATIHRYNPACGGWCPWMPLTDMDDATAALMHFSEQHRCGWRLVYLPTGIVRLQNGPFGCVISGGNLAYPSLSCELYRHAPTPTRAIVLTLVAASELVALETREEGNTNGA